VKNSPGVVLIWRIAVDEATRSGHEFIEPEHFLQAMTRDISLEDGALLAAIGLDAEIRKPLAREIALVPQVLEAQRVNPVALRRAVRAVLGRGGYHHTEGATVHRSPKSRQLFLQAGEIARHAGAQWTQVGHLLLAILADKDGSARKVIAGMHTNLAVLTEAVEHALRVLVPAGQGAAAAKKGSSTPWLDRFGRDLTAEAVAGTLGPVIGRRKEILLIVQTLARRTKNNPVLIGDAGVGKTAIVEALAIRIAEKKDAKVLGGKRIIEVRPGSLVAGTKYRGEFEERFQGILAEVESHPEIILFVDEIHLLVGAGEVGGGMDAANLMKPALARGGFRCIGATTTAEYRKYIEKDAALERRFERIQVDEPSREEALEILRGLVPKLESHHGAVITPEAVETAVDLTMRFDHDRRLPDKAIDVLDLAAARVVVPGLSIAGKPGEGISSTQQVTPKNVIEVLAERLQLPKGIIEGRLQEGDRGRLLDLESRLGARIVGQAEALRIVSARLLMALTGVAARRGPLAVFLFAGPTGVGKTELAKALGEELFGSEGAMIRLDMSEYIEPNSVAKLVGSPPGYVSYEEEGQLTGRLRSHPFSLVLLDEVEKAHPQVLNTFLQLFDEGRLTDAKGRTVDAGSAVFVMTSNVGVGDRKARLGFGAGGDAVAQPGITDELKKHFTAEFINRIDDTVVFRSLTEEDAVEVARRIIDDLKHRLTGTMGLELAVTDAALSYIAKKGYSEEYGVRQLQRVIEQAIQEPLARKLLGQGPQAGKNVVVDVSDDGLRIVM